MHAADRAAGREEGNVNAVEVVVVQVLHGDLFAGELHFAAGRTRAGQRHQLADRKIALGQDAQQGLAHGAGGAHHRYLVTTLLAHLIGSLV